MIMFKVYGYEACQYCKEAVRVLTEKGIDFRYVDVKLPENSPELAWLKSKGFTTVPQIYDHDVHVGGYDKLHAYLKTTHKE